MSVSGIMCRAQQNRTEGGAETTARTSSRALRARRLSTRVRKYSSNAMYTVPDSVLTMPSPCVGSYERASLAAAAASAAAVAAGVGAPRSMAKVAAAEQRTSPVQLLCPCKPVSANGC